MPSPTYKPPPFPSAGVEASDVAVSGTVLTRRMNTALRQAGGQSGGGRTITADTFISSADTFVWADTTAAGVTATLPLVSEYTRMWIIVERIAGANTFTVAARGSDTIDGGASITVTKPVMLTPHTNTDWHIAMISA